MFLRTIINLTLPALLALTLGGCINSSAENPSQPTTIPPPTVAGPETPATTKPKELLPTGFKTLSLGGNHGCIVKNRNDSLWCWGQGSKGQLGTNTGNDAPSPMGIGDGYKWQIISGGYTHTCGATLYEIGSPTLTLNRLLCWGDNSLGAVGYGTVTTEYFQPMVLQDDDWRTVGAGNNHSCAIRLDNTLWCWGDNRNSQLGYDTSPNTKGLRPAQVVIVPPNVGSDNDWSSVSASDQFSCALKQDQTLWCWGLNDKYQFGNNSTANSPTPQKIGVYKWKTIATGQVHGCGIRSSTDTGIDNTLWCWGDNGYGQIGNGKITPEMEPFQVKANNGAITTWATVTTGRQHTCAIALSDKSLWCWGNNETGQLGINSTAHQPRPARISHDKEWLMVAAGGSHTCAVDKNDTVYCWGLSDHGQLANGFSTDTGTPTPYDLSTNWRSIDSGYRHSCGLKGGSAPYTLWCSGLNGYGQLGIGSTSNQATLVQISANNGDIIATWHSLSTGPNHSCAIAINGSDRPLFCWGDNSRGQLGDNITLGNTPQHWWPNSSSQVVVGANDWSVVATGAGNSCGIKGLHELWCWGDNSAGQISAPNDSVYGPTRIAGSWLAVAVGGPEGSGGHICAIKADGTLWCWGKNDKYQLGNYIIPTPAPATLPDPTDLSTPTNINTTSTKTDTDWVSVKAGVGHTCALKSDNTLWCWGDNGRGQTGTVITNDPFPGTVTSPRQESTGAKWFDFDLGSNFTCAIRDNHNLWCWGDNSYKQLSTKVAQTSQSTPANISGSTEWQQVTLGQRHGCGIRENSSTLNRQSFCWGEGAQYQFGNGGAWKTTPQALSLKAD